MGRCRHRGGVPAQPRPGPAQPRYEALLRSAPFRPSPPDGRRLAQRDEPDQTDRSPESCRYCERFTGLAELSSNDDVYIHGQLSSSSMSTVYRTRCSKSQSSSNSRPWSLHADWQDFSLVLLIATQCGVLTLSLRWWPGKPCKLSGHGLSSAFCLCFSEYTAAF